MVERLGEMRKGRRERMRKEKETKKRRRAIRPCNEAIVSSSPQGMTTWSSSIKILFLQALECIIKRICQGLKQNAKICAIGETECNET